MAGAYHVQLLAHEFCDHLTIHAFGIRPLDDVVRYFNGEFHRKYLR